jgi:uncharacterized membrane protein YeaQ/YmgE (transglycosylase-associated protein family)
MVSPVIGGHMVGGELNDQSLGSLGDSLLGILGGGIVDVILQSLGVASDVLDAASLIGNIAVSADGTADQTGNQIDDVHENIPRR